MVQRRDKVVKAALGIDVGVEDALGKQPLYGAAQAQQLPGLGASQGVGQPESFNFAFAED